MSDIEDIKIALNHWMEGLDNGDLERMVQTCDPDVIICNEHQPTSIGVEAVREKYGPRIQAANFTSGFDIERFEVYGDMAILIGHFSVETTHKESGEKGGGHGRLVLIYRRHEDGAWKLILDIDNNDDRNAA